MTIKVNILQLWTNFILFQKIVRFINVPFKATNQYRLIYHPSKQNDSNQMKQGWKSSSGEYMCFFSCFETFIRFQWSLNTFGMKLKVSDSLDNVMVTDQPTHLQTA